VIGALPFVLVLACSGGCGQAAPSVAGRVSPSLADHAMPATVGDGTAAPPSAVLGSRGSLTLEPYGGCWLRPDGRVACWGSTGQAAYGDWDGQMVQEPPASHLLGSLRDVVQLDGHGHRRCAVTAAGSAHCWGHLPLGPAFLWRRVPPPDAVTVQRAAIFGSSEPCALRASGEIRCFARDPSVWRTVRGLERADAMAATERLLCARLPDRRLSCSGPSPDALTIAAGVTDVEQLEVCSAGLVCARGARGQVWKIGRDANDERAVTVEALTDATRLDHACASRIGGGVSCRRSGSWTDVPAMPAAESFSASWSAVCARTADGAVWCSTFPGNGRPTRAREVAELRGARTVVTARDNVCGILAGDVVRCARARDGRPVGPPEPAMRGTTLVDDGEGVCALHDGTVDCWDPGALRDPRYQPRVSGVTALERLDIHACGRRANGQRFCFSSYAIAEVATAETAMPGLGRAEEVAVGEGFACARLADGTVRCWGVHGEQGQLGDGRSTWSTDPVVVKDIDDAVDLDAGATTACAVRSNGRVWCWGTVPDLTGIAHGPAATPIELGDLADVEEIAVEHSRGGGVCARHRDGTVSCRGGRFHCDLPSQHQPLTEAAVIPGIADARRVEGGAGYFCAVLAGDRVACWGMATGAYDRNRACGAPPSVFTLAGARDVGLDGSWTCVDQGTEGVSCWGERVPFHPDGTFPTPTPTIAFAPAGP
jgi:hypothetical protein